MRKCYSSCLCLLIFLAVSLHATETLQVETTIDKTTLTTGDFVHYQIQVIHPLTVQLHPIELNNYLKDIDVEALQPIVESVAEDGTWLSRIWPFEQKGVSHQMTRWAWYLWPGQAGKWTIPEITIKSLPVQEAQKEPLFQGMTAAKSFTVRPLFQVDPQNPASLPLLKVSNTPPPSITALNWIWIAVIVVALLILGGIWFFYQKKSPEVHLEPEELPHERALRRLRELEQFLAADPNEIHQYYFLLSEIFREYLENRFGFSATTMTTQEFLPLLASETSYTSEEQQKIVLLTQRSDLIKYAEALPTPTEREAAYREVVTLIEKVAYLPIEEPTEETDASPLSFKKAS